MFDVDTVFFLEGEGERNLITAIFLNWILRTCSCAGLRTFEILADLHNLLVRFFSQSLNLQIQGFQIYTHKRSFEHELFWKFNATISSATRSLPATACSPPAASNIKCKFIIASRETNAERTRNDSLKNKRPWLGWIMLNITFCCLDSASCQRQEIPITQCKKRNLDARSFSRRTEMVACVGIWKRDMEHHERSTFFRGWASFKLEPVRNSETHKFK